MGQERRAFQEELSRGKFDQLRICFCPAAEVNPLALRANSNSLGLKKDTPLKKAPLLFSLRDVSRFCDSACLV